ncbi:MAG: metal-dependent phosphohydrolase [Desulfobulbaceae bacterium S3730MH12]|nr:MAG: metal-dependent phosphohydrolase [Desulfobulbaceae bacterium S5133MH15]OEU54358.1 MAG: metal-dependent phosphohydrolase [Desulfobulbaceae bacterium S3730MH12]OEU82499.1 MAG: metal-dependent phosphohydrolase [Desulfobulbaceae bacterium C00003063]
MAFNKEKQRENIESFIRKMPSLSTTVGKVMEICSRTDASPNELNKVISLDPILTGQVLKLINSAYYSLINKVTSLTRAITMLGMNTVKNIALSTAIIRTLSGVKKSRALPTAKFWEHSIGTGVSARLLGEVKGYSPMEREELFLAGLLHDLGKVPFGDEYIEVLNIAKQEQRSLIEVERHLIGIDHQEVGLMIAEKWNLNKVITECITTHHEIDKLEGGAGQQVALVALANIYTNTLDHGYAGDPFPDEEDIARLLELVDLSHDVFGTIGGRVVEEINESELFLQI